MIKLTNFRVTLLLPLTVIGILSEDPINPLASLTRVLVEVSTLYIRMGANSQVP